MSVDVVMVKERLDRIVAWLEQLDLLAALPEEEFRQPRNAAAAESFLRRSLEAAFDVGRHLLAKRGRFDLAQEYKGIARGLVDIGAVGPELGQVLVAMAGYRNRLVHFYHEVSVDELRQVVVRHRDDLRAFVRWILAYVEGLGA